MAIADLLQSERITPENRTAKLIIAVNLRKKELRDNLYSEIINEKKSIKNFNEMINDVFGRDEILRKYEEELKKLQKLSVNSSLTIINLSRASSK